MGTECSLFLQFFTPLLIVVPNNTIVVPNNAIVVPNNAIVVPNNTIVVPNNIIVVPNNIIVVPNNDIASSHSLFIIEQYVRRGERNIEMDENQVKSIGDNSSAAIKNEPAVDAGPFLVKPLKGRSIRL